MNDIAVAGLTKRASREIACCSIGAVCGLAGLALVVLWLLPSALATATVLGTVVGVLGLVGALWAARQFAVLQRRVLARFAGISIDEPPSSNWAKAAWPG